MLELRTFGTLDLRSTDAQGVRSVLTQPRRAALLCYLALASPRGFQRRDHLLALFWPEHDAEQARHALRQSVYFLRRALGPHTLVSRGDDELGLAPGVFRCDVWEFETALDEGRPEDALALHAADLLAGFHVSDAPDFERWLEAERTRLRDRAREAAWLIATAREQAAEHAGAAEAARRALALAPTDEIALRRLLLLLERVGDRAGAVRTYDAFAAKLRDEYELDPSPETEMLVARIRAESSERRAVASGDSERTPTAVPKPGSDDKPVSVALERSAPRTTRLATAVVIAGALLVLAGLYLQARLRDRDVFAESPPLEARGHALAVLPFALQQGAPASLREGLMDLVSTSLNGIPGLRTLDTRSLMARGPTAADTNQERLDTALARRAGGRYAVAGSVITDGPDLIVTARVHDVAEDRILGTARSRGSADSLFALADQLALEILRLLPSGRGSALPQVDMARVNTTSLPALKAYLEGEAHFRRSEFERAAEAYGRAVEADSGFALALYRLGNSRQWFWRPGRPSFQDPMVAAMGGSGNRLPPHAAAMFRAFLLRDVDVAAARELLEEEARRHINDVDTWFELGEFYHHSGDQAVSDPEAAPRAFSRALALDSTFSPPYKHRIEHAVRARDTVLAGRLLDAFARFAPEAENLFQVRRLVALAFGDPVARAATAATLDTLDLQRVLWLSALLAETRHWDLAEQVLRKFRDRGGSRSAAGRLHLAYLAQGRAGDAYRLVKDPDTPEHLIPMMLQLAADAGARIPTAGQIPLSPISEADTADPVLIFYRGAIAGTEGRWEETETALRSLQARARRSRAEGDSTHAGFTEAARRGLAGYRLWREGRPDRAEPLLRAAQQRAIGGDARKQVLNANLRWWLGRLLTELGRPREALPYFESLAGGWFPADYERGRLYEQLGMTRQAREAYTLFLEPRQRADSAFQPAVQHARAALERLPTE